LSASSSRRTKKIYQGLNARLVMEKGQTEITAFFTALAAALSLRSAALSLLWFNRLLNRKS
jgi:Ca-activated chloride channel homolog